MSWLRFLIKVSFICNICYLIGFIIRMLDNTDTWEHITKTVMVLGGLVAAPLNIVTCLLAVIMLLRKKARFADIHPVIFILNVIILLLQLELFL
ncbi:hypothetical protein [Chitinophaga barathri]|uniref:Uncharacterized protein n=1 Tax=Chitinophaga barathri TaxID=1647451 RepID=A0A3N4MJA6_9BACT|nr:hypothetical protein [Chitinophaga barathri]RPD41907.1 hypothetical protein EG028_07025 [Chitinophaga barathri]